MNSLVVFEQLKRNCSTDQLVMEYLPSHDTLSHTMGESYKIALIGDVSSLRRLSTIHGAALRMTQQATIASRQAQPIQTIVTP